MAAYKLVTRGLKSQTGSALGLNAHMKHGTLSAECHWKTMQQKYLPLEDAAVSQTVPFYLPIYTENNHAMQTGMTPINDTISANSFNVGNSLYRGRRTIFLYLSLI